MVQPKSVNDTMFSWSLEQEDFRTLLLSIIFAEPDAISTKGIERDKLRVIFTNTTDFLHCKVPLDNDNGDGLRSLAEVDWEWQSIPQNYVVDITLPP